MHISCLRKHKPIKKFTIYFSKYMNISPILPFGKHLLNLNLNFSSLDSCKYYPLLHISAFLKDQESHRLYPSLRGGIESKCGYPIADLILLSYSCLLFLQLPFSCPNPFPPSIVYTSSHFYTKLCLTHAGPSYCNG